MAHRRISPFLPKNFLPDAPFTDTFGLLDSWEIITQQHTAEGTKKKGRKTKIEKNKKSSKDLELLDLALSTGPSHHPLTLQRCCDITR